MSPTDLAVRSRKTQGSNNAAKVRGSFQETAPRKTAENTVKHRDGESSVVVTTLHFGVRHSFTAVSVENQSAVTGWHVCCVDCLR